MVHLLRFHLFVSRPYSIHIFQTSVLNFKMQNDTPVPVWQSPWHNRISKNVHVFVFVDLEIVMFVIISFPVSVQVASFKVNDQCQCDTYWNTAQGSQLWCFCPRDLRGVPATSFATSISHLIYRRAALTAPLFVKVTWWSPDVVARSGHIWSVWRGVSSSCRTGRFLQSRWSLSTPGHYRWRPS